MNNLPSQRNTPHPRGVNAGSSIIVSSSVTHPIKQHQSSNANRASASTSALRDVPPTANQQARQRRILSHSTKESVSTLGSSTQSSAIPQPGDRDVPSDGRATHPQNIDGTAISQPPPHYGQNRAKNDEATPPQGPVSPAQSQTPAPVGQNTAHYGQVTPPYGPISPSYGKVTPYSGQVPHYDPAAPYYGRTISRIDPLRDLFQSILRDLLVLRVEHPEILWALDQQLRQGGNVWFGGMPYQYGRIQVGQRDPRRSADREKEREEQTAEVA